MPTIETIIDQARSAANAKITEINGFARELTELREQASPDAARIADLTSRKAAAENDLPDLQRRLQTVVDIQADDDAQTRAAQERTPTGVERQAPGTTSARSLTYTERNGDQYFKDLWAWSNRSADPAISDRLQTHTREIQAWAQQEQRAVGTTSFGGIVPPQYLIQAWAQQARAGRPVANTVNKLELPDTGMSLVVPKGTTGSTAAVQATQNTAVSNTDMVETDITVPVVTIAGQQDVSRQAIERGVGIQQIVFADLAADYAVKLDQQVLVGTGSSGQSLGILNTSGVTQGTAFTAAVTVQTFYPKLAGALNSVETTRYMAPTVIYMHPRRWNWLVSQLDTTNRPLATPQLNGPNNATAVYSTPVDTGSYRSVGTIAGVPVVTDASIPTTVGSASEDQVIVARSEDLWLWENNDGAPSELVFEQTLGAQLTIKLVAYGYMAFTAARYPTSVSLIGGNAGAGFGLIAPTF